MSVVDHIRIVMRDPEITEREIRAAWAGNIRETVNSLCRLHGIREVYPE